MNNIDFLKVKNEILSQEEIVRFVVPIDQIIYKEVGFFQIDVLRLKITSSAFTKFLTELGMGKGFINNMFSLSASEQTPEEIFRFTYNAVKLAVKKPAIAKKKLVVVYHTVSKTITNIYAENDVFLNVPSYLELIEKVANRPNVVLRSFFQNMDGTITLSYIDKDWDFSLGSANEIFQSGLEYNYLNTKLQVNFFNLRLVCTNGMVATNKISSRTVEGSSTKIPEFIEEVTSKSFNIDCKEVFQHTYNKAAGAQASLGELLTMKGILQRSFGFNDPDKLFPVLNRTSYYSVLAGFNQTQLEDEENHKFYRTPLTKWDLVNEITAVSSALEQGVIIGSPSINRTLQVKAGGLLFAPNDLGPKTLKQVY